MTNDPNHDPLLDQLTAMRPELPPGAESPDTPEALTLYRRAMATRSPRARVRRRLVPVALATAAAVVAAVAITASDAPRVATPPPTGRALPAADIRLVAAESSRALSGSGRAEVEFVSGIGSETEQRGVNEIAFSGDDLDMTMRFGEVAGRPGFEARNRTVDGEFYLLDGAPGEKRWYHDTNASGTRSGDIFNADPRQLLDVLDPSAGFELVDRDGNLRHLRATTHEDIPTLNLGLGPSDDADVTNLELWITPDDVVQRLTLEYEVTETFDTDNLYVRNEKGDRKKVFPSGAPTSTTHRHSYSVRFFDLGEPIAIHAPPDAEDVAGQG